MAERVSERRYRGLPPEVRQADRQRRFREAGLDVFCSTGYMSCSVPELCRVAGVSTRRFSEEFSSREGLLIDLYPRTHADARSLVGQAVRDTGDREAQEVITAGITAYIHALTDDPRLARLVLRESVGVNAKVDRIRDQERAEWSVLIENAARKRLPHGHTPLGGYHTAMVAYIGALNAVVD